MNKDIKEIWTAALESNEYKQGHNVLRIGDEYCCLGVLCDLYHKHTGLGEWTKEKDLHFFCGSNKYLPLEVKVWADLKNGSGEYSENSCLAGDNDSGKSFKEIAQIIREKF